MAAEFLDVDDLDDLFAAKGDEVFTYLKALSRDPELAADLSQSVLLKFIEQVEKGTILRKTATNYLFTMCKNEFLQHIRKYKREERMVDEGELPSNARAEKVESISRDIHSTLIEAINGPQIPDEIAEVLRARFLLSQSMAEICASTGKSRTTIFRITAQGMGLLEKIFREVGLEPELLGD